MENALTTLKHVTPHNTLHMMKAKWGARWDTIIAEEQTAGKGRMSRHWASCA